VDGPGLDGFNVNETIIIKKLIISIKMKFSMTKNMNIFYGYAYMTSLIKSTAYLLM